MKLEEQQLLLQEIFAVPSKIVQSGRFEKNHAATAAGCSGNCKSPGGCMRIAIEHDDEVTLH